MEHDYTFLSFEPFRYEPIRHLGDGGMAYVLLAKDKEKNKEVAIKVLKSSSGYDVKGRFKDEFESLKKCNHPNIVEVYDYYEENGHTFFTMEYLEGQDLRHLIQNKNALPPIKTSTQILFATAKALYCVHKAKMIHRDLTPANIFITKDQKVKLLDFGIAKAVEADFGRTSDGAVAGTRKYMSPEQDRGEVLDERSDIYSFGLIAYELLSGEHPLERDNSWYQSSANRAGRAAPIGSKVHDIPEWLAGIVDSCLEKDRDKREDSFLKLIKLFAENSKNLSIDSELEKELEQFSSGFIPQYVSNIKEAKFRERLDLIKLGLSTLVLGFILMLGYYPFLGHKAEVAELRSLFWLRGPTAPPEDIVIVAIDDLSYKHFGVSTRKPFPRKYIAQALQAIHKTEPKIVFVDAAIQKETEIEDQNLLLIEAIKAGPTVIAPIVEKIDEDDIYEGEIDHRFGEAALYELPVPIRRVNGVSSHIAAMAKDGEELYDHFPMLRVLKSAGLSNITPPSLNDLINFYGPPNTIQSVSLYEVIQGKHNFSKKIVFFGVKSNIRSDVPGAYDTIETSGAFNDPYFGVEVHATIALNLIDGSFIRRLPQQEEYLAVVLISYFLFSLLLILTPRLSLILYLSVITIWCMVTWWLFNSQHFYFPAATGFALVGLLTLFKRVWDAYRTTDDEFTEHKKFSGL